MCQLCDFSHAVPLLSQRRRRTAATAAATAALAPAKETKQLETASVDSQDGLSSEAVTRTSRPDSPVDQGDPQVPLWALSSFHAAPVLMHTFVGIVEHDVELVAWKDVHA
eukprot:EG_transcript_18489